ncbi:serine beta-lactamase-like protein LACTB, mitochondrial isoform X1 [Saccostrea echinata]|uniref:serine beta-lactamase-like protein LACTB, mitochondrial isoform X1 n=1 Tax=Saccostrea echinata TaxID=191078 RepID=UPI002A80F653|nr:serine beta-lactamase-like protein LACTB, mitochondrial isoform X1 [Saccostrea echinata]
MHVVKHICRNAKKVRGLSGRRQCSIPISRGTRSFHNDGRGWIDSNNKTAVTLGIVAGISVGVVYIYNVNGFIAECKTSTQKEDIDTGVSVKPRQLSQEEIIEKARDIVQQIKDECGSPGLVVGVSVDGQTVWTEGLGYADVENRTRMRPETVLRIASISKPITMAAVAKQWEIGKLDLDKSVQYYVPSFPEKKVNDVTVQLTTRQLVSQMGGIRHYRKDYIKKKEEKEEKANLNEKNEKKNPKEQGKSSNNKQESQQSEMELEEYYITRKYKSVAESLTLFQDDPLVHSPGSKFLYTTHGWTLISAVLEAVTKEPFEKHIIKMVRELGMENTFLDEHSPLIYNRGRHYVMNNKSQLRNAPYVDLSYKWAGGGLLSNIPDLLKFGNAMLYSYQCPSNSTNKNNNSSNTSLSDSLKQGFLKQETMKSIWTPLFKASKEKDAFYGMGWFVDEEGQKYGQGKQTRFCASHTGAAVGGSSVLLILPTSTKMVDHPPKGVVVVVIVNMMSVNLIQTAMEVAKLFENFEKSQT